MIAIAVVASLVVYAWVSGYMGFQTNKTGKSIQIQSFAVATDGLHVYVQNVGQGVVTLSSAYVNDTLQTFTPASPVLPEGNTADIIVAGTYNANDKVNIRITTSDGTFMTASGTVKSGGASNPTNGGNNAAPVIDSITPTSTSPSVATGGSLGFTVTAHDPDTGDTLSYKWFLDSTQQGSTTNAYTYSSASGTSHTVRVDITDGKVTTPTSQSWTVTVPCSR